MSRSVALHNIRRDFLSALQRLQAGRPKNRELRTRAEQGRLKINPFTVALEAGHSRTLIGTKKKCRLPDIRDAIIAAKNAAKIERRQLKSPNQNKPDITIWKDRYSHVLSINAGLSRRIAAQEIQIERLQDDLRRAREGS